MRFKQECIFTLHLILSKKMLNHGRSLKVNSFVIENSSGILKYGIK